MIRRSKGEPEDMDLLWRANTAVSSGPDAATREEIECYIKKGAIWLFIREDEDGRSVVVVKAGRNTDALCLVLAYRESANRHGVLREARELLEYIRRFAADCRFDKFEFDIHAPENPRIFACILRRLGYQTSIQLRGTNPVGAVAASYARS